MPQKYKLQERQINLPVNKLEFSAFTNSRKAETSSYERRLISKSLDISFSVFYFLTKYFSKFELTVHVPSKLIFKVEIFKGLKSIERTKYLQKCKLIEPLRIFTSSSALPILIFLSFHYPMRFLDGTLSFFFKLPPVIRLCFSFHELKIIQYKGNYLSRELKFSFLRYLGK